MDLSGQPMVARASGAAQRRKLRRLRAALRHEQQSIAMALASALHHSADKTGHPVWVSRGSHRTRCSSAPWSKLPCSRFWTVLCRKWWTSWWQCLLATICRLLTRLSKCPRSHTPPAVVVLFSVRRRRRNSWWKCRRSCLLR